MKLPVQKRSPAIIPTASMADIAFLLIIFFMVTTVQQLDKSSVQLPEAKARIEPEKGAAIVAMFRQEGVLTYKFSDGKSVSKPVADLDELDLAASSVIYGNPEREFMIKADHDLEYAKIDELIDKLRRAGVKNFILLAHQDTVGDEGTGGDQ